MSSATGAIFREPVGLIHGYVDQPGVRSVPMEHRRALTVTGHKTDSICQRDAIADAASLEEGLAKLATLDSEKMRTRDV